MKRLLCYLKDYKKESILSPLFKMLEASFELFVPLVMAAIIDNGIGKCDTSYIIKMGLLMVMLGLIGLICSVTAQYYAAKASVGFAKQLRHSLFSHIQGFSFTQLDVLGTSTVITRMTSDINQVQSGVNLVLRLFLRSPFIVLGAMVMAFTIDVKGALIFVVTIPLLSVVVFGIMLLTMPLYKKVQSRLDGILKTTKESLSGARVIRAFHKEEQEILKFSESNQNLTRLQQFVGRISSFMNPLTYIIVNTAIIALLYTGAVKVDSGTLTQGAVIALVNYMSQILVELIKLANLIITVSKALACAKRIESVLEVPSSPIPDSTVSSLNADSFDRAAPILSFEHVSLTYEGASQESLSDLNFQVMEGQTVGIIGGTGSGKTSLVHLIPGFYRPSKGKLLYRGKDSSELSVGQLREKIGIVMQKAVLFSGTIRDNLKWGNENATDDELWKALELSQAKEFVEQKEYKLEELVAQGGKNLSGGQRQRLTIARALVKQPEILILDDSASALDYATDAKLRAAIKSLPHSLTTFIVSQRASSIMHANLIIVLEDGEITGIGTHEDLLKSCEVYQEIYYSQFPKEEA